jgi:hypothetical protein
MGTRDISKRNRTRRVATEAQNMILGAKIMDAVAAGASVAAAAEHVNITPETASRLLHAEFRRFYEENASQREELVGRELRKLELLERPFFRKALDGDEKAADRVLAIIKQRREILGLDAAAKVAVEVSAVDDALAHVVNILDGEVVEPTPLRRALPPGETA